MPSFLSLSPHKSPNVHAFLRSWTRCTRHLYAPTDPLTKGLLFIFYYFAKKLGLKGNQISQQGTKYPNRKRINETSAGKKKTPRSATVW